MASKNVYFFKIDLFCQNQEIKYQNFKEILESIVDKHAIEFDGYKSLDVTPYEEEMHLMMDIYELSGKFFFARMSKQRPSNSMIQHDYRTYKKEEVLPGNNEKERGIEQYTFGLLNYEKGVFLLASSMGAPNEKVINNVLSRYASQYSVELTSIPNAKAIESIYEGKESEITKLEIEVPLPQLGTLENVFHWKEGDLLETLEGRNLSAAIVLKPLRRQSITKNEEETKKLMDIIKSHLPGYTKAKMTAKAQNVKLRDYNFFVDKFSYPITIQNSTVSNGERIYYTLEDLVDIYKAEMKKAYNANKNLLQIILDR